MTTYHHLAKRLKIRGAIPPIQLYAFMACIATTIIYEYIWISMLVIAVTECWFEAFVSLTKQDTNPPTQLNSNAEMFE
jgi:hypothetical protein